MKKELFIHFTSLLVLLLISTLTKGWFSLSYWPFWIGAIIGMILPDIDHLIYTYFLRPQELTSQRVSHMVENKDVVGATDLLYSTNEERVVNLIFHKAYFQAIFFVLTIFVITSSGSILGRGLVLAFCLHLLIDQIREFRKTGNINNWLSNLPISLDKSQQKYYLIAVAILVLIFTVGF